MFEMWKIIYIVVFLILIYESIVDIKSKSISILPNIIIGILAILNLFIGTRGRLYEYIISIITTLILFLIAKISNELIGYADIIGIGVLGILVSGYDFLAMLFLSFLLAGFGGLCIKLILKKNKVELAYYPFLTFSYGITVLMKLIVLN